MAKTLEFEYEGKAYTLEFTRATVKSWDETDSILMRLAATRLIQSKIFGVALSWPTTDTSTGRKPLICCPTLATARSCSVNCAKCTMNPLPRSLTRMRTRTRQKRGLEGELLKAIRLPNTNFRGKRSTVFARIISIWG